MKPRDAAIARAYRAARKVVLLRAAWACEGCGRRLSLESCHAHHRLPRSPQRIDCPCNLLALCLPCHESVHAGPKLSRHQGRIITRFGSQVPAEVPVLVRGVWVWLNHDGTRTQVPSHVLCDAQRTPEGEDL